jgi:hypothetical protein
MRPAPETIENAQAIRAGELVEINDQPSGVNRRMFSGLVEDRLAKKVVAD